MLAAGEEELRWKIRFLASVGRQDVQIKQVTPQEQSWARATVLADGVHLGVDWQRKLYVSKIDLPIGPCPPAPTLFFPVSTNGIPILPGVQVKGLGVTIYWARPHMHTAKLQANPVGSLFQTHTEGDQVFCLHHHCLGRASFSVEAKAA